MGLSSPRFRLRNLAAPLPAVLCVATTTFVRPGWFAFGSRPVPWVDALFCVSLPACAGLGSFTVRVERQTPGCCFRRSPLLRLLFPRRREVLPSSRITPLNACPDLRSRWCPIPLALARAGLLPSSRCNCRLWVRLPGLILCPPLYIFRDSIPRPASSPYLCFAHRLSTIALRFGYRPGG